MKGEYYTFTDEELPRYSGRDRVFGVGNVVTGQGNIRVSLVHSQKVTTQVIENYLGIGDAEGSLSGLYAPAEERAAVHAAAVKEIVESMPQIAPNKIASIEQRIRALQQRAGYTSDYDSWIANVTPPDLE